MMRYINIGMTIRYWIFSVLAIAAGATLALFLPHAFAALPIYAPSELPGTDVTRTGGFVSMSWNTVGYLMNLTGVILELVALIFMVWYGIELVITSGSEDAQKRARTGMLYTCIGFVILNIGKASFGGGGLIGVFNPASQTPGELVRVEAWRQQLNQVIDLLRYLMIGGSIILIVITGMRMVAQPGSPEVQKRLRPQLLYTVIGLTILSLAEPIQRIFVLGEAVSGVSLINSITLTILWLVVPITFIMIIYSAFRIVTSRGDEAAVKHATATIIGAVIALAIVFSSYTILSEVISLIVK